MVVAKPPKIVVPLVSLGFYGITFRISKAFRVEYYHFCLCLVLFSFLSYPLD